MAKNKKELPKILTWGHGGRPTIVINPKKGGKYDRKKEGKLTKKEIEKKK